MAEMKTLCVVLVGLAAIWMNYESIIHVLMVGGFLLSEMVLNLFVNSKERTLCRLISRSHEAADGGVFWVFTAWTVILPLALVVFLQQIFCGPWFLCNDGLKEAAIDANEAEYIFHRARFGRHKSLTKKILLCHGREKL